MDFEAIKQALVMMGSAMVKIMDKIEEQTEIQKEILIELKKINESK